MDCNIIPSFMDTENITEVGDFQTTATLYSALETLCGNMLDHECRHIFFRCYQSPYYDSASQSPEFFGVLFRSSSGRYYMVGQNPLTSEQPPLMFWKWSGGWTGKKLYMQAI